MTYAKQRAAARDTELDLLSRWFFSCLKNNRSRQNVGGHIETAAIPRDKRQPAEHQPFVPLCKSTS